MKVTHNLTKDQLEKAGRNLLNLAKSATEPYPGPENPKEAEMLREVDELFNILVDGIQAAGVDMLTQEKV